MRIFLLDTPGLFASVIIGALVLLFSGAIAIQNFLLLLFFLVISVVATRYKHEEKKEKGLYEFERGWQNVISNGIIAALCPVLHFTGWFGAFIGALAGATADKFGSELGVLSGKPISLKSLRHVKPGTSGAISALGTLMTFVGALLIGLLAYFFFRFDPIQVFLIALVGFAGALSDTIAGVLEEEGIGNKQTSNLICTIVAALLGMIFLKV